MLIENARLSFPALFQATAFQAGQTPKYQATLILPKDHPQLEIIKASVEKAAKDKWGDKALATLKSITKDRYGLRDGDEEKPHLDGFANCWFFNASTDKRPSVFNRDTSPLKADDAVIYAGCFVNAQVEPWAQDNQYGKRINWSLRGIQFVKDGEAFGGSHTPASEDEFPVLDALDTGIIDTNITGTDDFLR